MRCLGDHFGVNLMCTAAGSPWSNAMVLNLFEWSYPLVSHKIFSYPQSEMDTIIIIIVFVVGVVIIIIIIVITSIIIIIIIKATAEKKRKMYVYLVINIALNWPACLVPPGLWFRTPWGYRYPRLRTTGLIGSVKG